MRIVVAISVCFVAGSALADPGAEYRAKVERMADDALTPALENHPERWTMISLKYRFHIDPSGRIRNIRIVSAMPNRWVDDTVRHALARLKLPPVPRAVMLLNEGADAEAELILAKTKVDYEKLVRNAHR